MTNQQGAPETPRPTQRYKIGYHSDEWGVRSNTPGGVPDPAGSWVRYEDHLAALVEAQQPTQAQAVAVPLTDEQIRAMCKESWVFETVKQWVRITEQHHGIKGGQHGAE